MKDELLEANFEGYMRGRRDAYAIAALLCRKVKTPTEAADILQDLSHYDEANDSPMEQNTGKAKDAI